MNKIFHIFVICLFLISVLGNAVPINHNLAPIASKEARLAAITRNYPSPTNSSPSTVGPEQRDRDAMEALLMKTQQGFDETGKPIGIPFWRELQNQIFQLDKYHDLFSIIGNTDPALAERLRKMNNQPESFVISTLIDFFTNPKGDATPFGFAFYYRNYDETDRRFHMILPVINIQTPDTLTGPGIRKTFILPMIVDPYFENGQYVHPLIADNLKFMKKILYWMTYTQYCAYSAVTPNSKIYTLWNTLDDTHRFVTDPKQLNLSRNLTDQRVLTTREDVITYPIIDVVTKENVDEHQDAFSQDQKPGGSRKAILAINEDGSSLMINPTPRDPEDEFYDPYPHLEDFVDESGRIDPELVRDNEYNISKFIVVNARRRYPYRVLSDTQDGSKPSTLNGALSINENEGMVSIRAQVGTHQSEIKIDSHFSNKISQFFQKTLPEMAMRDPVGAQRIADMFIGVYIFSEMMEGVWNPSFISHGPQIYSLIAEYASTPFMERTPARRKQIYENLVKNPFYKTKQYEMMQKIIKRILSNITQLKIDVITEKDLEEIYGFYASRNEAWGPPIFPTQQVLDENEHIIHEDINEEMFIRINKTYGFSIEELQSNNPLKSHIRNIILDPDNYYFALRGTFIDSKEYVTLAVIDVNLFKKLSNEMGESLKALFSELKEVKESVLLEKKIQELDEKFSVSYMGALVGNPNIIGGGTFIMPLAFIFAALESDASGVVLGYMDPTGDFSNSTFSILTRFLNLFGHNFENPFHRDVTMVTQEFPVIDSKKMGDTNEDHSKLPSVTIGYQTYNIDLKSKYPRAKAENFEQVLHHGDTKAELSEDGKTIRVTYRSDAAFVYLDAEANRDIFRLFANMLPIVATAFGPVENLKGSLMRALFASTMNIKLATLNLPPQEAIRIQNATLARAGFPLITSLPGDESLLRTWKTRRQLLPYSEMDQAA